MTYSKDYKLNSIRLYRNRKNLNLSIPNVLILQNIVRSTLYRWIKYEDNIKNNIKKRK